ncbi:MAG TPA: DeoR/GlpR transcriptional regulator [Spirochaetales bacterium]|nr:DeoR/GlpR transcriptional regulator [Spirochaetales bacterium]
MKIIEKSFLEERQHQIVELLKKKKRFTVKELSQVFNISGATIRSDLKDLAEQGKLIRTHGGAMYNQESGAEFPFNLRKTRRKRIKEEITVITNSLEVSYKLALLPNLQVISLGGRVRRESLSLVDAQIDPLVPESIGKAFMGALGLSLDQGLTDVNPSEITVKQSIARRSRVIIALVDSTKWDKVSYGTFVPTGQIHTIISDQNAPENMVTEIEKRGIKVIQVPTYFKDNR